MNTPPRTFPSPARVTVPTTLTPSGFALCTVERATEASFWVRWAETIPGTNIRAGRVTPVPKRHVTFEDDPL